eukprot:1798932-Rhodomonas_salina.1
MTQECTERSCWRYRGRSGRSLGSRWSVGEGRVWGRRLSLLLLSLCASRPPSRDIPAAGCHRCTRVHHAPRHSRPRALTESSGVRSGGGALASKTSTHIYLVGYLYRLTWMSEGSKPAVKTDPSSW